MNRRWLAKIRKVLVGTLLWVLLFLGLATVFLRNKATQTYVAQKAMAWLSTELKTTVKLDGISINLFGEVHVEGLYVEDQRHDTAFAFEYLNVDIDQIDRNNQIAFLKNAEFGEGIVHIGHYKKTKGLNIDFLINYFDPPRPKGAKKSKPWAIKAGKVALNNLQFDYFDESKKAPEPGIFDEFHIVFSKINGFSENFSMVADSLHFQCQELSMVERSGLEIENFTAICNIHNKGMDFTQMEVRTPCSLLADELHFSYPGYKYLDEFISNTEWNGYLRNSSVCINELRIFQPILAQSVDEIQINAHITGTVDKLNVTQLEALIGNYTRIKGNLRFVGLPNWKTTYCEFNFPQAQTSAYDLSRLLLETPLPPNLYQLGKMVYEGTFIGYYNDFTASGVLQTDLGTINTDVAMDFKKGYVNGKYRGEFNTESFHLGSFFGLNPSIGHAGFNGIVDGHGLSAETFEVKINAQVPQMQINGAWFGEGEIIGTLNKNEFNGFASVADPDLNLDFEGNVQLSKKEPVFHFISNIYRLNLKKLGVDSVDTYLSGKARVDAEGTNYNDFSGNAELLGVQMLRRSQTYTYPYIAITKTPKWKGNVVSLDGSLGKGKIQGELTPSALPTIAMHTFYELVPSRFTPTQYLGKDSFTFSFDFPNTDFITTFIHPHLQTGPLKLEGHFYGARENLSVRSSPMNITYEDWEIKQIAVETKRSDSSAFYYKITLDECAKKATPLVKNFYAEGDILNNVTHFHVAFADRSGTNLVDVSADGIIMEDSIPIHFGNSKMKWFSQEWEIENRSVVTILEDKIVCNYVYLDGITHYIELTGSISESKKDTLHVDFANFNLSDVQPFLPIGNINDADATFTGKLDISSVLKQPRLLGNIYVRDIEYKKTPYGELSINLSDEFKDGWLGIDAQITDGPLQGVKAFGSVAYDNKLDKQFDVDIYIPDSTSATSLQPFFDDVFTIKKGILNGSFHLGGNVSYPQLSGGIALKSMKIKVDYLGTSYDFSTYLKANNLGIKNELPIKIFDESGKGTAKASLEIKHKNYADFYLDFKVDSARNLMALNTTKKDNEIYYGVGYADGNARIYGPFNAIRMDIDLKSRKNTLLKLPFSDYEENTQAGYIKFKEKKIDTLTKKESKKNKKKTDNGVIENIDIRLALTEEADVQIIFDERIGDVIKGNGSGDLRVVYDKYGVFSLFGTYVVASGQYNYTVEGLEFTSRKIEVDRGGTITWNGDPFNAILDVTASYERKLQPTTLMLAVNPNANNEKYPTIRVISQLKLKGSLFKPDISFDIQTPDLENSSASSANDVYAVIQRVRANPDETTRQAISILLFDRFVTPSFGGTGNESAVSGTALAGNSIGGVASGILNSAIQRTKIPLKVQVNFQDTRNGQVTQVFVNTELNISDRLRLDVNYDPTVAIQVANRNVPVNLNLEYSITERLRFRAFSRSSNLLLQQSGSSSNSVGVTGNTLGSGLVYKREFNTFIPYFLKDTTGKVR